MRDIRSNIGFGLGIVSSVITVGQFIYLGIPSIGESPAFNYMHGLMVSLLASIAICFTALHIGYIRRGRKSEQRTDHWGTTHQSYPSDLITGVLVFAILSWGAPFIVLTTMDFGAVGMSKTVPGGVVIGMIFGLPLGICTVVGCAIALHRLFNPD